MSAHCTHRVTRVARTARRSRGRDPDRPRAVERALQIDRRHARCPVLDGRACGLHRVALRPAHLAARDRDEHDPRLPATVERRILAEHLRHGWERVANGRPITSVTIRPMRIVSIGGGPAGLYFAILMKRADPSHEILVVERNGADDTFGFGVVFSDATLENFQAADRESHAAITRAFAHWDDIDTHYAGQALRSTGHGFAGMSRQTLLTILQQRCAALGVTLRFATEVDDLARYADADLVLAADGANSWVRAAHADRFGPRIDWRPNRFVWLGTTFPFPAFTFIFKEDEHGLWRVHAYRYNREHATFILETTEATWRRAGLDRADEAATATFAERLFARELDGHRMLTNRSLWRQFP